MILRPQRHFTVVRQIANHLDTDTYYVRAVIRDAFTDEILDTLNLEDKGGQRFTKSWLVAPDPSGEGREISIVTSVYTDSGYTTKSENYGDEENSHMIESRQLGGRGGGGIVAGAGSLGISDIRRVIQEELDARKPEPIKFPEMPKMPKMEEHMRVVLDRLDVLEDKLSPEKVDLSPVIDSLTTLGEMIENKEVTPKTDLSPVLEAIDSKIQDFKETKDTDNEDVIVRIMKSIHESLLKKIDSSVKSAVKNVKWKSTFTTISDGPKKEEMEDDDEDVEETKQAPFDINKLTK